MRRLTIILLTLLLLGITATAASGLKRSDQEPIPGLAAEVLASGPVTDQPGKMLLQLKVTLEPGASVPPHIHPGDLIFSLESGAIEYTTLDGDVDVTWGKAGTEEADRVIAIGETATLEAGDWLVERDSTVHTVRTVSDAPAVLLISGLVADDEPFLQLVDWPATPIP